MRPICQIAAPFNTTDGGVTDCGFNSTEAELSMVLNLFGTRIHFFVAEAVKPRQALAHSSANAATTSSKLNPCQKPNGKLGVQTHPAYTLRSTYKTS